MPMAGRRGVAGERGIEMKAWYSKKMDAKFGYVVYRRANGEEVECTCVTNGPDHGMGWDDVEDRGEVVMFVRSERINDDDL